ncbi:MAG: hypothetical protein QXV17_06310 [Candidatus Micrarchaeaceae archaeon]
MIAVKDFSMEYTFESGQPLTFYGNYNRNESELSYVTSYGAFTVTAKNVGSAAQITARYSGIRPMREIGIEDEVRTRLGLADNMNEVYGSIDTDSFMHKAIARYRGMRVTKSEPWEASLAFVISQFNNIKRIRGIMTCLLRRFGRIYADADHKVRLFPEAETIANASAAELARCGAGFRSRYIKNVAREFVENNEVKKVQSMAYEDAKELLMTFDGIGDKVADCILLMGYRKFEAFPIDTWVKRVLEHAYFNGSPKKIRELHEFAYEKWGHIRGYAQQYIFWYGRSILGR